MSIVKSKKKTYQSGNKGQDEETLHEVIVTFFPFDLLGTSLREILRVCKHQ